MYRYKLTNTQESSKKYHQKEINKMKEKLYNELELARFFHKDAENNKDMDLMLEFKKQIDNIAKQIDEVA